MVVLAASEALVSEAAERSAEVAVAEVRHALVPAALAAIGFAPALRMGASPSGEVVLVPEPAEVSLRLLGPIALAPELADRTAISALRHATEAAAVLAAEITAPGRLWRRTAILVAIPRASRFVPAEVPVAIVARAVASIIIAAAIVVVAEPGPNFLAGPLEEAALVLALARALAAGPPARTFAVLVAPAVAVPVVAISSSHERPPFPGVNPF